MNPRHWLLPAALAACAACAAVQAAQRGQATPAAAPPPERQVLLMLRAAPPHFRPDAGYGDGYRTAPGREARRRIARSIARAHGLSPRTDWPMPALGLDCFVLDVPQARSVAQVLRELEADPRVESAQAMQTFHLLAGAGQPRAAPAVAGPPGPDPLLATQPAAAGWHLVELHRVTTGCGVLVAVVDSRVDAAHPDLHGQVAATRDFVDGGGGPAEAHGTEVAGIIAARAGNGVGIVGIAPGARLLALRACSQPGRGVATCSTFALARALQFAIDRKAQVLNLSLSGPRDRLLGRLLDVAMARGATVVAAVDGQEGDGGFPASHAGVLAVATDDAAARAPADALRAPGQAIPATLPDGGWGLVSGSSYAAAQVSGLVALLRRLAPGLGPERMRGALAPAGLRSSPERPRTIDACAAAWRADARCACNCAATSATTLAMPRR